MENWYEKILINYVAQLSYVNMAPEVSFGGPKIFS
jgi:hypothetical protein